MSGEIVEFPSKAPEAPAREPRRRPPEVQAEMNRKSRITRDCGREVYRLYGLWSKAREIRTAVEELQSAALDAAEAIRAHLNSVRDEQHQQPPSP